MKKLIVIGGGASGLFASILAAKKGIAVTLCEHTNKLGKKLLSTGNGKCNMTNMHMNSDCFYVEDKSFLKNILAITPSDLIKEFNELGLFTFNNNGYIYPSSLQASSVRNILTECCYQHHVNVKQSCKIVDIKKENNRFLVITDSETMESDYVLLATGGCALKSSGSDGSGYLLAEGLGHTVTPVFPALTALISKTDKKVADILAGVRAKTTAELFVNNSSVNTDSGEVQFTKYGLSGIVIFNLSHIAVKSLSDNKKVAIRLNLIPEFSKEGFLGKLSEIKTNYPKRRLVEQLSYTVNSKLAEYVFYRLNISNEIRFSSTDDDILSRLYDTLSCLEFEITSYKDYDFAQVTSGGINISEIDSDTMMSKICQGLYFAGEIMDVDGICGGYNLHFAWSSAMIAVEHMGV